MTSRAGDEGAAVVAADLLGAFGVGPADVRAIAGVDDATAIETAVRELLAAADSPAAALRGAIVESSRGFDLPLRYRPREPYFRLSELFDAVGWSFAMTTDGTPVEAADDVAAPFRVGLEDATGVARDAEFSYPDSPLGADNAPALLGAINERLLYGLEVRFVLLSGWTDRWRFAFLGTDDLAELRDRFGERLPVDGDPLLAPHDPRDFLSTPPLPDPLADDAAPAEDPDVLIEDAERTSDDGGTEAVDGDRFEWGTDDATSTSPDDGAVVSSSDDDAGVSATGGAATVASSDDDAGGTATTDGFELVGESTTVTLSAASDETTAESGGAPSLDGTADGPDGAGDRDGSDSAGDDWGFDGGSLSGSPGTERVSNDAFGADVDDPDDAETYAAFGAAIEAEASLSVAGLLDDDEFVPEFPASGPTEVRIEFEDSFDPADPVPVEEEAGEDGFVWINGGAETTTRTAGE